MLFEEYYNCIFSVTYIANLTERTDKSPRFRIDLNSSLEYIKFKTKKSLNRQKILEIFSSQFITHH
jgi:hypothetical protein